MKKRPKTFQALVQNNHAGPELETAERYFVDRMAEHNSEFVQRHPQPKVVKSQFRWMQHRESYVMAEVEREMENWVVNYPTLTAKRA